MRTKHLNATKPAERIVKDIRRATRKHYSAEEKIRVREVGLPRLVGRVECGQYVLK